MWSRLLKKLCLNESWVIFFILGIVMMNYPFISIFNRGELLFDIPLLFLYLMVGWPISILVVYLFTRAVDVCEGEKAEKEGRR